MSALLEVDGLVAGYATGAVLQGIDLNVGEAEIVAVLGRNGVGKTTLMQTLMGMTRVVAGRVRLAGCDVTTVGPTKVARAGAGYVPQGRRIFPTLSVDEHLRIAGRPGRWTTQAVYELFPRLLERHRHGGAQLSGGEQQMLAVARALVGNPRLLLLDEPSEGLAPALVIEVMDLLRRLADEGMGVLLVEQDLDAAMSAADRVAVLDRGIIVHEASVESLRADRFALEQLLLPG